MSLEVRKTLRHHLDAKKGPLCKGLLYFAVQMGISQIETEASDSNGVFQKLGTRRESVYRVLIALDKIDRHDAVKVVGDWLQRREQP
ncbi:hypothetical protein NP493_243g03085 [Ridgeia piscesae]|uniref:Uncharacterized protein n=1 Tax=Ridgeia piscesae TaxID=27915 RepID=A0AAD9NZ81_RIDPI|nr:hypothetical protein NP493_243g03085 [Ridgeia piscesae]